MSLFNVEIEFKDSNSAMANLFETRHRIESEISKRGIGEVVGAGTPIGGCLCDLDIETHLGSDELSNQLHQVFDDLRITSTLWIEKIDPNDADAN